LHKFVVTVGVVDPSNVKTEVQTTAGGAPPPPHRYLQVLHTSKDYLLEEK